MNRFLAYGAACVLTLLAAPAGATTIVVPTDGQLIAKSPLIVRATVVRSTPIDRGAAIWTETILQVDEAIKGQAPAVITVREPGGTLGDRITKIYGSPEYSAGESVLAFLTPTPRNDYQTVDMFIGRFEEARAVDGTPLWVRDAADPRVDLLGADLKPLPESKLHRNARRFESFVAARAAGRAASADYFVDTPKQTPMRAESNFTLIDEPTVYRWFAFDSGVAVPWRSHGTQPGYTGGGIDEVRTAMSSWTSYAEARILYSYDGSFSTAPAGLSRSNGVNEILLNDPLSEIAGSFDRSTGGVVGRGGFNGVSSRRSWTSPFAADATHGKGTYSAWNITEGNLVIQDGVSPSAGMSANRLAEILAHEFGHTLGFGHSDAGSALMYATVTGIGPQLRDDDKVAARWLYPSGSGATPNPPPAPATVPAAPSNLVATPSGSSIVLQWTDNAGNETGQRIYYASATGAFAVAGEASADQRSVTLTGFGTGTWRFYVTAWNPAGESAASNTVTVTIAPAAEPLVASFTWSPQWPVVDDPVSFTDTSTGGVTSRFWNFGDTTSSGQATPVKRYSAPGTYTVTLTVYRGSESRVTSQTITVGSRTPVLPPVEPYRSLVPVSGQSEGVGGSVWRTELTLFNAGNEGVSASLIFVPGAGGTVQSRNVFLSPRQTLTYGNALRDIFGMSSGSGAIAVEASAATSTPALKVTSRTFNDTVMGTYGLAVPDVVSEDLQQVLYLTGLANTADFRTNIGLVNRSGSAVTASLALYNPNGSAIATASLPLPPNSFRQEALTAIFPAAASRISDGLSVRASLSAGDAVSIYAAVVDNRTHDPVYIAAVPQPGRREALVPVAGRAAGANNTFWRSDVTLFNPNGGWMNVTLRYAGRSKTLVLMSNETVVLRDIVAAMGADSGLGTLALSWDGASGPIVTTRNYTESAGGGTFGQSIDPVASMKNEVYVTGVRSDSAFRANLGFVNGGPQPISVEAFVYAADGSLAGTAAFSLGAGELRQAPLAAIFPNVNTSTLGHFTLHARASAATLVAYGSVIDNASGDPVFFGGR